MKAIVRICVLSTLLVLGSSSYARFSPASPNVFDVGDTVAAFLNPFEDSFHRGHDYKILSDQAPSTRAAPGSGTMILLGIGMVGLAGWGRKRFRK